MKTFFIEQNIKKDLKRFKIEKKKIIIKHDLIMKNYTYKTKLVKKIVREMKCKQVVVDKNLKEDIEFINLLYSHGINICNKEWLFKRLASDILERILEKQNLKKENLDLYICVNDVTFLIEHYIYEFVKEFRRITIVTNHIGLFKKIEDKIYQEHGVLINVTNNRSKTLSKAQIILNFDFPKEVINEFNIYDKSIIINLEGDLYIRKDFKGKIISDFKIEINDELIFEYIKDNKLEKYDIEDICQALEFVPKDIKIE